MVPLSSFFATDKVEGEKYSDTQKQKIEKWFWRSLFTRRYSAGVNDRQAYDITEFKKLKSDENYNFKFPQKEIKFDFTNSNFAVGNANSKSTILLLSSMNPYSFLSGATIDLDKILSKVNKNEFHHIFPLKHLERLGISYKEANVAANICFLTRGDNNSIKDEDPKVYSKDISTTRYNEYMERSLIPNNFGELNYPDFLQARSELLKNKANELMT